MITATRAFTVHRSVCCTLGLLLSAFLLIAGTANAADHDGDGMDDAWEVTYGLNTNDPGDAVLDGDNDLLRNLGEYQNGCDPTDPDSDGDTLYDGWEVSYGFDPTTPGGAIPGVDVAWRGAYDTDGDAQGVFLDGNTVYVADGTNGLVLVDVTQPTNPSYLGFCDTPNFARRSFIDGSYAYVADEASGLQVIDVSNPAAPSCVGSNDTPGGARDVYVAGSEAYVADYSAGMYVFDISTPAAPNEIGSVATPAQGSGVSIDGNYAYLADGFSGLQVIDITTPTNPAIMGGYNTTGFARKVFTSGNYAYVADWDAGFEILNISTPTNPSSVAKFSTTGQAWEVVADGDYAYAADDTNGLVVADISTIASPELVATYHATGKVHGVVVDNDFIYLANGTEGLLILENLGKIDDDGDGMLDSWEITYFGSIAARPNLDFDGDGISNWGEYLANLHPGDTDTDGDGQDDGFEMMNGANPNDASSFLSGIAGQVTYSGGQTGTIYVIFTNDVASRSTSMATPGAYSVTNLLNLTNYYVEAYRDTDGDTQRDFWEAQGVYPANPLLLAAPAANIDILLNDPDSDSDGMPDWWELLYGLNPNSAADASDDEEPDGLDNLEEYQNNTIPTDSDTDNDGMPDGWEVDYSLNPTSAADAADDDDGDCLSNLREYQANGIPTDQDSDNDTMWDGWEWAFSSDNALHTNAMEMDLRDNGSLNPSQARTADMDGDGANNGVEFGWWYTNQYLASGCDADPAARYSPDPTQADTDSDGLNDGFEIDNGLNPVIAGSLQDPDNDCLNTNLESMVGTSSIDPDTDDDGLWDGWEWTFSTNNPLHTNALAMDILDSGTNAAKQAGQRDLDGDGASNLEEFGWWYTNQYLASGCDATSPTNRYSPDPTHKDTDGDTLGDGWEMLYGLNPCVSNSASSDTDGDGFTDFEEFEMNTNPNDPRSPVQVDDNGPNDPVAYDPEISDPDEDGSPDHPFDAIQEAILAAGQGDVILVRDGTYSGKGNRDITLGIGGTTIVEEDQGVASTNVVVTANANPNTLLNALVNTNGLPIGVSDISATFTGDDEAAGVYTEFPGLTNSAQPAPGIILSSGKATDAVGPNASYRTSQNFGESGDTQLAELAGGTTYDAVKLTISFTTDETIHGMSFKLLFGSDEFPEWVGSFNDAFGAFLDGVNISFDENGQPITVNNNFFLLDNDIVHDDDPDAEGKTQVDANIEYDGLTPLLITKTRIEPGNHILELVISDTSDAVLDSAVFLSQLEFSEEEDRGIVLRSENGPDYTFIEAHSYHAGVIFPSGGSTNTTIDGFSIRSSYDNGGVQGIICSTGSAARIQNCRIWECGGAGIECGGGSTPIISNCVIEGGSGYGLSAGPDSMPTILNSLIISNAGIGVYMDGGKPQITDTDVRYNSGGGVFGEDGASPVLRRMRIEHNKALGGVYIINGESSLYMENLLIAGNSSATKGAGIFIGPLCGATGYNCTVTANTGDEVAGAYWEGEPVFRNFIIAGNASGDGINNTTNAAADIQYSILGNAFPGLSNRVVQAQLDASYYPLPGSPAIDSGTSANAPDEDIDLVDRPLDGDANSINSYDIGCYEYEYRGSPLFDGLETAVGGTNQEVSLSWSAVTNVAGAMYYHVYQGTTTWACSETPSCSAADVFAHEIAVVTNTTSYIVTNVANDIFRCYGVRAESSTGAFESNTVTRSAAPVGPGDPDGDCLDNAIEQAVGTDFCGVDTDGDGMWDGWEWTYSTNNPEHDSTLSMNPLDAGQTNEMQAGRRDLDGDGASNLEEFGWWYTNQYLLSGCDAGSPTNRYSPDPTKADTDEDGLGDGWEIRFGMNPAAFNDGSLDSDGDGFTDAEEFEMNSDPLNAGSPIQVDDNGPNDPVSGDPEISDPSEDGSVNHPYDAIQEAISAANQGDVIFVRDGTYSGVGNRDIVLGIGGTTIVNEDQGSGGVAIAITPTTEAAALLGALTNTNNLPAGVSDLTVTLTGDEQAAATYAMFPDTTNSAQPADGIILSSGQAAAAAGPNDDYRTSTSFGTDGDDGLDEMLNGQTFDAVKLTLSFITDETVNGISFQLVFGSEEFPEWVGSFNDAFAAFLDGENISFDENGQPITVNNNFFQLDNDTYHDTDPDAAGKTQVDVNLELDGLTPLLITKGRLSAGAHTLELVIADTSDAILDSVVFLSKLQFIEEADRGIVVRSENGPDYTFIESHSFDPAVTFPSGGSTNTTLDGFSIRSSYENGGVQGIICSTNANPRIVNCRIWECGTAGIEALGDASPFITNVTVVNNQGPGMKFGAGSTPLIRACMVMSNSEEGVVLAGSSASILESQISWNEGGGIAANASAHPVLRQLRIRQNDGIGGVSISGDNSSAYLENNLIVENTAQSQGGGIYVGPNCGITGFNCTVSANTSPDTAGIKWQSKPVLRNMIIWGNNAGNGMQNTTNVAADIQYCILGNNFPGLSNQVVNPMLTASYGLSPASPAIDAGTAANAPIIDLNGALRPQDGDQNGSLRHDAGCFEYEFTWILNFDGIESAQGGTNGNVMLSWTAVSNVPGDIFYQIYQGTQEWACGETPDCEAEDVFNHLLTVVTNASSHEITGLSNDVIRCYGVRADSTLNASNVNNVMLSAAPSSGSGDPDDDCLPNDLEILAGTELCVPDTDRDGMWDGWEWTFSTNNPLHTSPTALDPLDNGIRHVRTGEDGNTNQLPFADIDGDGLSNIEEFGWWYEEWYVANGNICDPESPTNRYGLDPTIADTDGDGMADGWEVFNDLQPLNPADGALDADGDGVANSNEYAYGTHPLQSDSDADGLLDGAEIAGGTDPSLADTDHDGLDDGFELLTLGTDPMDADSNDSNVSDGDLFQLGWDDPSAGATNYNYLLDETFEPGSPTVGSWTEHAPNAAFPFEFWHLSTAEPYPDTNAISYLHDRSTNTSYRHANDATGADTAATYGITFILQAALESPAVDASGVNNLMLAWNQAYDTEPGADLLIVKARGSGNTNWSIVYGPASGRSEGWTHQEVDISQYAGMSDVQVQFLFTANNLDNEWPGWYVDDVQIYEGAQISGWVRDNNGRALSGARVIAIGRGGVTNAIDGHRFVLPGAILGEATSSSDGSYMIRGLPFGRYYVKAGEPSHKAEFYDGQLFSGAYAFGQSLNPGVEHRALVNSAGWLDLTAPGATATCRFELQRGIGRANLGVLLEDPSGQRHEVFANGLNTVIWNGNTNAPALNNYLTSTNASLPALFPDWITNPVEPNLLGDLAPGSHYISAGTNLNAYPVPMVTLREGETVQFNIYTNQSDGRLYILTDDGEAYTVWLDGRATTNVTPTILAVKAGTHSVTLSDTNDAKWLPLKTVSVPIGGRATARYTTNQLEGAAGSIAVSAVDINGTAITGASVYVNGQLVTTAHVAGASTETPITLSNVKPGTHIVNVRIDGYRRSPAREVTVYEGQTGSAVFPLYQADRDYDQVGDRTESSSYTNLFLYTRDDDPDADGLSNLFEFELFQLFGVYLNIFNSDSDSDLMTDGEEVGYDGITNAFARSALETNVAAGASSLRALFVGDFLAGVNNFGNGNVEGSIECDLFQSDMIATAVPAVPTEQSAVTILSGIPSLVSDAAVSSEHLAGVDVLADALPDERDSDGDGMWDGFEAMFGPSTLAKLNPISCSATDDDPDGDGLSNLEEFLGPDGIANTNDWTDPTSGDTDSDGMPDGWEYTFGFDPNDASDIFGDPDGDGLPNLSEYIYGTNPHLADTDADGLPDMPEVLTYHTDPNDDDTDDDGLLDGREVWDRDLDGVRDGGFFPAWTPTSNIDGDEFLDGPTDWDSDGDNMPDGFEVVDAFGNIRPIALDPTNPTDGDTDPDGDGLTSYEEYLVRDALVGHDPAEFGFAGATWDYTTDPFNGDSDGDGMPDGWEVMFGLHPRDPVPVGTNAYLTRYPELGPNGDLDNDGLFNDREFSIRFSLDENADSNAVSGSSTRPWDPDSDNDGLGDGEEDRVFRSNPVMRDTDGDGLLDGVTTGTWGEVNSDVLGLNTNHFDEALNDIWRLVWPVLDRMPHWERVTPDDTNNVPAPRWGGAAVYIPVFESYDDCCAPVNIAIDNRKIIVFGGTDGVSRYADIWEFLIPSNEWSQVDVSTDLDDLPGLDLEDGLSDLNAITLFGYPYFCDETATCLANVPQCRPWDYGYHRSSFEYTMIFGGWDEGHKYKLKEPMASYYFKSEDRPGTQTAIHEPQIDGFEVYRDAWQVFATTTRVFFAGRTYIDSSDGTVVPFGERTILTDEETVEGSGEFEGYTIYYTNTYVGINAFYFNGVEELEDIISSAYVVFNLNNTSTNDLSFRIFTELDNNGRTSGDYFTDLPSERFTSQGWAYNSAEIPFTIPAGASSYTVDVTSIVAAMPVNHLLGNTFGMIVYADPLMNTGTDVNNAQLAGSSPVLRIETQPWWIEQAHWREGTDLETDGELPSKRKSMSMVYDYDQNRIVAFGGMDGNTVFNDTFEGTPEWNIFDGNGHYLGTTDQEPTWIGSPSKVDWEKITTANAPEPRWGHSMVYDGHNQRVVLFGGFNANHEPLNDFWAYANGAWTEITDFMDGQKPSPRGGAHMVFYGGYEYNRGLDAYCLNGRTNNLNKIILFGGTDGRTYFNDTWVYFEDYDSENFPENGRRWMLADTVGEMSKGPTPRAFGHMVYAQNGRYSPDVGGSATFVGGFNCIDVGACAEPAVYLFGGRSGTLPTSPDTDDDLVEDGREYELGSTAVGRDPRRNALIHTNENETIPFAITRLGSITYAGNRGAIANLEALSYPRYYEYVVYTNYDLPFQGRPLHGSITTTVYGTGIDAATPDLSSLWYHKAGGDEPRDDEDAWELGIPDDGPTGEGAAPPSAYSGRWCYGTDLDGLYPVSAIMELYSPQFDLLLPASGATSTNGNSYFLVFHEWLALSDSNDWVRVDVVRPKTQADAVNRISGQGLDPVTIVARRNNAFNTKGNWRRVIVPLGAVENETNLFLRFTLQSDAVGRDGGWYIDDVAILQGAELSGMLQDAGGAPLANADVNLFGSNLLDGPIDTTQTDASGYFEFGLLPFGDYSFGSVNTMFGPYSLGAGTASEDTGTSAIGDIVVANIDRSSPTTIWWAAVPGTEYRIEHTDSLMAPWQHLATVTADAFSEHYSDYSAIGVRFYRIRVITSRP